MKKIYLFLFLLLFAIGSLNAQDDLLSLLGDEQTTDYTTATFKTTRIVNGHPNSQLDELMPWAYQPVVVKVG